GGCLAGFGQGSTWALAGVAKRTAAAIAARPIGHPRFGKDIWNIVSCPSVLQVLRVLQVLNQKQPEEPGEPEEPTEAVLLDGNCQPPAGILTGRAPGERAVLEV